MDLNIKEIRELMADLEKGSLREVNIQEGDFALHLSKNENITSPVIAPVAATSATPVATTPVPTTETVSDASQSASVSGEEIKAPMVGTVYLKPKPDMPDFKQVGDHVEAGETVAIIEAMKLMTDIKSDVTGTIAQVLVKNEEVVDYDKPLYLITVD
ncbi:acetyl-CoA carboxylase biotin carboxyl carrier protein [Convivina praedatoris]|uniref:Biotin carboxyl carrier protein of acetyl-CoA carboxylase n=1 Tax=Convivina praedatoris TaxID=2880963 RepID=A0ABM9D356_9LACO|nr:acetyl-CoA carboxylase biotin carboxyl carrier protein [Convivina sp. LMG 32447]CAH1851782.1 Biotin carboxyl carrier protein of acetyl-CoA carboxylase [Convivina sp. LMG 32447]CAH1851808.1 Biotin carboxyl carrier protein of acetyl-CoA carboxylase [Convivina sp. LMG 32447]CAH1853060.1 Biotin carboxyl carrier protein of acetyl-CoA carboxylase [Convivina sp. LMG 32447]